MTRRLVIFGAGEYAEVALAYFRQAGTHAVVAFAVDREFATADTCFGYPLVAFEDLPQLYPPEDHDLFVAIGYARVNGIRRAKYETAKTWGYQFASFISDRAVIHPETRIGEHCFILDDAIVEPFASVGDNVTVWTGAIVGHFSAVASHSFLGIRALVAAGCTVGEQCYLGAGSVVHDHVTIGARSVLGTGVLLLTDAAAETVLWGHESSPADYPSSTLKRI